MRGTNFSARKGNRRGDENTSKNFWMSRSNRVKAMQNNTFMQLGARLLPPDICAQIGAGTMPSAEIAYNLAVLIADCEALNDTDRSSWTERRLSKQMVAVAGLVMLGFAKDDRL